MAERRHKTGRMARNKSPPSPMTFEATLAKSLHAAYDDTDKERPDRHAESKGRGRA